MATVLVLLLVVPLVASVGSWFAPARAASWLTMLSGAASFALALAVVPATTRGALRLGSWIRLDSLSTVFLLAVAFLYATTAIFTKGYLVVGTSESDLRYARRFYAGLNLFCWTLLVAPMVNGLALLWVAVEMTTVISALLVAIDDTEGASEAAWKYVMLASLGLGVALLGTIMMYAAGTSVFGASYNLSYVTMLSGATRFHPDVVRFAFVLGVLGYGTKMGLFPVHTWLPDAHSEAPTPVSALLSGALLAVSFYAILRFFQVATRTLGFGFPREVLLVFGVATLLIGALYLLSQRDMKRLLAYSSVEHMGILAVGMSFGATIAIVGVLLQVLAHAAAKASAFYGVGSVVRKFATKDMIKIRGGFAVLPWSAPMLVLAVLALSGMPPFGLFRSEFDIVYGGLSSSHGVVVGLFVLLILGAFFGLSWSTTETMLSPTPKPSPEGSPGAARETKMVKSEVSYWMVAAMALCLGALLVLGVHPPLSLTRLLTNAAHLLEVGR